MIFAQIPQLIDSCFPSIPIVHSDIRSSMPVLMLKNAFLSLLLLFTGKISLRNTITY